MHHGETLEAAKSATSLRNLRAAREKNADELHEGTARQAGEEVQAEALRCRRYAGVGEGQEDGRGAGRSAEPDGRAAIPAVCGGQTRAAGGVARTGRGGEGRDDPARDVAREPAGVPRGVIQTADAAGGEARFSVAYSPSAAAGG